MPMRGGKAACCPVFSSAQRGGPVMPSPGVGRTALAGAVGMEVALELLQIRFIVARCGCI
jgi:hypothetical protein